MILINLKDINRTYETVVGIGSACDPTIHIKRLNLRKCSLPLDWLVSLSLNDVNKLLKNKFDGFMELENMKQIDGTHFYLKDGSPVFGDNRFDQPVKSYFVKDTFYNMISVHDFPIIPNQDWTVNYPAFKQRMNKRIARFLELMDSSQSILFVRWSGIYKEAAELQAILSNLTNGLFHILIINPDKSVTKVSELNWGLNRVCSLNVPDRIHDVTIWNQILKRVSLKQ